MIFHPKAGPMSNKRRYGAQKKIDIIHRTNAIKRSNDRRRNDLIQRAKDWIGGAGHTINQAIGYNNAQALKNLAGGLLVHGLKAGASALTGVPFGKKKTLPLGGLKKPKRTSVTGRIKKFGYKKGVMLV